MGFKPCWAEPDIWMCEIDSVYEYTAVYVDDLVIAVQHPQSIIDNLNQVHKFKLKGSSTITYHLGMDFYHDDDNVLCIATWKYIFKMMSAYEQMFGPQSLLEKRDHPELDTSDLLDAEDMEKYQSLIGVL